MSIFEDLRLPTREHANLRLELEARLIGETAPADAEMMRGKMLWFNEDKGFGFIRTDDGERLYVHRSGFEPTHVPVGRCADRKVSFQREAADVEGGHQAVCVSAVVDTSSGRARRHRPMR